MSDIVIGNNKIELEYLNIYSRDTSPFFFLFQELGIL